MASCAWTVGVDSDRDTEESSSDGMSNKEESDLDREFEGDYVRVVLSRTYLPIWQRVQNIAFFQDEEPIDIYNRQATKSKQKERTIKPSTFTKEVLKCVNSIISYFRYVIQNSVCVVVGAAKRGFLHKDLVESLTTDITIRDLVEFTQRQESAGSKNRLRNLLRKIRHGLLKEIEFILRPKGFPVESAIALFFCEDAYKKTFVNIHTKIDILEEKETDMRCMTSQEIATKETLANPAHNYISIEGKSSFFLRKKRGSYARYNKFVLQATRIGKVDENRNNLLDQDRLFETAYRSLRVTSREFCTTIRDLDLRWGPCAKDASEANHFDANIQRSYFHLEPWTTLGILHTLLKNDETIGQYKWRFGMQRSHVEMARIIHLDGTVKMPTKDMKESSHREI
ncbi:hypothetical protein P5673_007334 [Acropora cervicornis]|uniref:Uncharacterized protein n=1 Tax=Acropora cervicornis TaxID=6130 RepID=A0AAD9VBH4_ACRCE|nr:hypothetical protein P5673_007334 [Acropora cervicornis]